MHATRSPLRHGAIFTAVTVLSVLSSMAHAADTLSVVTFGGAYESAAKQAWFEPFTAKTGIGFSTESYDGGLAKLSAMEQAKNPTWDLIDLETNDAITACDEGLLQKFDRKQLGNTADFLPGSISDCAVSAMVWSTVYAYDTTKLKTPPTSINDFFDLKKYPGKRGMRKSPKVAMEWALIADGVARRTSIGARHACRRRPRIQEARHDQVEHRLVGRGCAGAAAARGRRGRDDAGL